MALLNYSLRRQKLISGTMENVINKLKMFWYEHLNILNQVNKEGY